MMNEHGAYKNLRKMNVITKILRILDFYKNSPVKVISRQIVKLEFEFSEIMPGRTSKFYESAYKTKDEIMSVCKGNLN
jgi:hypothetical protein